MRQFQKADLTVLVDALAEYSEKYYRLIAMGGPERDIVYCRIKIHHLLQEINSQKNSRQLDHPATESPDV
jgi:hypothetical protein